MAILGQSLPSTLCLSALVGAALLMPLTDLALQESPLFPAIRTVGVTPAPENGIAAPDLERLKERIEAVLEETETPGAAVALIDHGRVSWRAAFGFANVERKDAVSVHTQFRVGSISKTFVAIAVLQLVEAGKLRLDQTVRELAPEIEIDNPWEATHPVRLVHLLEHTAGFDDWHLCEYAHQDPSPIALEKGLGFNPRSRSCRWPPGTHFSYSNGGPPVAARIVEKITGESFEAYVTRNVLAPLEMEHASFLFTDEVRERLATGYRGSRLEPVDYWHLLLRPAGALNASISDLGNLVEMMVGEGTFRGRQILRPESLRRMLAPESSQAARAGLRFGYGLGTMTTLVRGRPVHGHDGGLQGYLSSYAFKPGTASGYVVLVNRSGPGLVKLDALLRSELAKMDAPVAARPAPRLTPEEAAKLVGTYRYATPRSSLFSFLTRLVTVRITADEERVYLLQGKDRVELLPAGENLFRVEGVEPPILAFVPGPGGGMELETGYLTFRRAGPWGVRLEKLILDLFGWLWIPALSTCIRLFFRGMFRNDGRGRRAWLMPLLPVLACVSLFTWWIPLFSAGEELIVRYGRITLYSLLSCALSWGFAVFTLWSVAQLYRNWTDSDRLECYWAVACASIYQSILLAYFLSHGLVGLMTWWY